MAGSIRKRADRVWQVRIALGRDASGKRHTHTHTVRGTKKDAERYRVAQLRERDLGTFVEPARITLSDYLDDWLKARAPALKPKTLETYSDRSIVLDRKLSTREVPERRFSRSQLSSVRR